METVVCNLCGSAEAEVLFEGFDRMHGQPGRFSMKRCCSCGLIYLSPRPDRVEIGLYYPENYAPYSPAIDDEQLPWNRWNRRYGMFRRVHAILSRVQKTGRALDVGCATGNFLDALRRRGWEVYGVEPNTKAATYARQRFGLSVFEGELVDSHFPENWFDLTILWDVLEHTHDPKSVLYEAARITRPGGMLVLSLPNVDSVEARIFGPYWAGWDIPRHLHIFTHKVLIRLLNETGWQMKERFSFTGRYGVLALSLRFWCSERLSPSWLCSALPKLVESFPARFFMLPYYLIVEHFNSSPVITVLAQRYGN